MKVKVKNYFVLKTNIFDDEIIKDVRSLVNFLHNSSIILSKERLEQVDRIRDAMKDKF